MTLYLRVLMRLLSLKIIRKRETILKLKLRLNHFEIIFSTFVLLVWTLGGAMNWIDGFWSERVTDPVLMGTFFILSIMLIASFIDLPFSIYRNFVLEQKFGFNRMTVGTFAGDLIKEVNFESCYCITSNLCDFILDEL